MPVAITALLLAPRGAIASNFTVTPTEVNLSTSATSALVTLRNGSKLPLRFEITVVSWSEDEHGTMALNPSSDVTFFPKLVELPAVRRATSASASMRARSAASNSRIGSLSKSSRISRLQPSTSWPSAPGLASRCSSGLRSLRGPP